MGLIDQKIDQFYSNSAEDIRLTMGLGPLEFERNKLLISRYLGDKMKVADIGGGSGHYAKWLANLGHEVTLIDPVQKLVNLAQKRSKSPGKSFHVVMGEARKLPFSDRSLDLIVFHGPLYHIQDKKERIEALEEAWRVLKPGGKLLGFAISHSASTVAALQSGLIVDSSVFEMCKLELTTGIHHPPSNFPGMLPAAFYHRPAQLEDEYRQAGLIPKNLFPVEGMAWLDGKFFEHWADVKKREVLLKTIELTENDRDLLGFSPHFMLVGEREKSL